MDSKKRILIVDDEETIAWGISKTLSQSDLGVETAYTTKAKEALNMINQSKFDMVITDIRMPEMSGIDLLREVKEKFPETGVVIMTAYGSTEVQQEASKRGSIFYIEKPFDIKVLKNVISDFFQKKSAAPVATTDDEASFQGDVGSLQLMDVVQMNCLGRISCTLKIQNGNKNGAIVFKKGDIVHADIDGKIVGKEAFFAIAGWKGGSFEMLDDISSQVTILDNWEQLLIEALQAVDDGSESAVEGDDFDFDFGQTPSGQVKTENTPAPEVDHAPVSPVIAGDLTPTADTSANDTATLLERIIRDTNSEAVFIMTPDGFVIDRKIQNTKLNIEKSGEDIAKSLSAIIDLSGTMLTGNLIRIFMTFKDKNLVIKGIPNSDLLIVLSIPSSKNMESLLPIIEREAQNLSSII